LTPAPNKIWATLIPTGPDPITAQRLCGRIRKNSIS
jgi:hypothetical protein